MDSISSEKGVGTVRVGNSAHFSTGIILHMNLPWQESQFDAQETQRKVWVTFKYQTCIGYFSNPDWEAYFPVKFSLITQTLTKQPWY